MNHGKEEAVLSHKAGGSRHGRKRQRRRNEQRRVFSPSSNRVSKSSSGTSTCRSQSATEHKVVHHGSREVISSRGNGHNLQGSYTSRIARTSCPVCQNRYSFSKTLSTPMTKLNESKEKGCPTCTLILRGISEFFKSLYLGTRSTLTLSAIERLEISCSRCGSLSIRLEFNDHHPGFILDFFTLNDSPSSLLLRTAQKYPSTLGLEYCVGVANEWINECNSHGSKGCQVPENPPLPTRLLDFGDSTTSSEVKLLVTNGELGQYVCLSYCWGNKKNGIKTNKDNVYSHTRGIPLVKLPRTFQDAIALTKALKIRYLWIDALCILQGEGGQQDWEIESANMASVYSNSYLTIAATAGPDPDYGLLFQRWTLAKDPNSILEDQRLLIENIDISCEIYPGAFVWPRFSLGHKRFMESDNATSHLEDAPLMSRAWAFQERLLSARTLHFHAEELIWECKASVKCECTSLDDIKWVPAERSLSSGWLKASMFSESATSRKSRAYAWLDAVSEFSMLQITQSSDRIPALSGLTKAFSTFSGKVLGNYFAGIWEHDLARGLLFERVKSISTETEQLLVEKGPCNTADIYEGPPSWSWTSIALDSHNAISFDSVIFNGFLEDSTFRVIYVQSSPVTPNNPFGWASDGKLEVKGKVVDAILGFSKISSPNELEVQVRRDKYSRTTFSADGRNIPIGHAKLLCLLVGHSTKKTPGGSVLQYVLVLKSSDDKPECHERVGILQVERSKRWFFNASSKVVTII